MHPQIKYLLLAVGTAGNELSPADTQLLTQQGGTLVFEGTKVVFKHVDTGILGQLKDMDALLAAVGASRTVGESGLRLQEVQSLE